MLWDGLIRYNRKSAGPFRYSRTVLAAKDDSARVLGGFRRFGGMRGSPPGASRHYYLKQLTK